MKKIIFLLTVIFVFQFSFLPLAHSAEIETKQNFSQGETLIAKVSGNFFDTVKKENLFLYREHTRVPFLTNIEKINSDYYLYGDLENKIEGNYSLRLENTRYFVLDELRDETVFANFTIQGSKADFSVNPAVVITNKNFEIQLKNLKTNSVEVRYSFSNISSSSGGGFLTSLFGSGDGQDGEDSDSVTLSSGETKTLEIQIGKYSEPELVGFNVFSENTEYNLPIYISEATTQSNEQSSTEIYFQTSEINLTIPTNSKTNRIVYIKNPSDSDVSLDLTLSDSLKQYVSIASSITEIKANKTEKINLSFSSEAEEFSLEGSLIAKTNEKTVSLPIYFYSIKGFIPSEDEEETIVANKFCSELNGIVCSENQRCDVKTENSRDGVCCLGTCVEKRTSSVGKWIGWILIAVLILVAVWFYFKKYKKTDTRLSDIAKILGKKN